VGGPIATATRTWSAVVKNDVGFVNDFTSGSTFFA
jgi:hypothetical protein